MCNLITKDFEPSSAAAWKQKIQFELQGADYNTTLLTNTNEGITIKPFYHSNTFEKVNVPVSKEQFKICKKIIISSEIEANLKAINAIKEGVDSIKFIATNSFNTKVLFKNLLQKNIEFHFHFKFLSEDFIFQLFEALKQETVFYNIDIIGNLAKTGNWHNSLSADFKIVENIFYKNKLNTILSVNVDLYQNSGANTVQQVAYALAHANEYFTKFGGKIASNIQFNFATGSNYFFEISKIRAFRYLYHLILNEYNCNVDAKIYTEPSLRNKTLYNSKTNLARTATENFSAIIGGANTVSNNTYDSLFKKPNEFSGLISLNQLLVLKKESSFFNAQHIATDSYYIESITKQIAEKALVIFKDIEKSGGFLSQLKEGTIQRKIKENAQKEQAQFNAGELFLIGINKCQQEENLMKNEIEVSPFILKKAHKTLLIPIVPKRLAAELEQKRLKNEA